MSELDNQIDNIARAERGENVNISQNGPKTDLDKQIENVHKAEMDGKQNTSETTSSTQQNEESNRKNPSVQLALNGQAIYMYGLMMSVSVKREQKDMSGSKSSTKNTEKGVKAKELQVSGIIPYDRKEWLTTIFKLAEAETGKGEQSKYRVSSVTAEAVNMREVQFADSVTAQEMENRLAWQVSFTLREVNSVAEKKEARKAKPQVKTQGEKAPVAQSSQPQTEQTGGADKAQKEDNSISKKINDWLGP